MAHILWVLSCEGNYVSLCCSIMFFEISLHIKSAICFLFHSFQVETFLSNKTRHKKKLYNVRFIPTIVYTSYTYIIVHQCSVHCTVYCILMFFVLLSFCCCCFSSFSTLASSHKLLLFYPFFYYCYTLSKKKVQFTEQKEGRGEAFCSFCCCYFMLFMLCFCCSTFIGNFPSTTNSTL